MCSVRFLTRITHCIDSSVKLPNGECAHVTHIGEVQLSPSILLINVLCIPSFSFNLLSVSKLTMNHQCSIIFLANQCYLYDLITRKTIGMGELGGDLYYLSSADSHSVQSVFCFHAAKTDVNLWHLRLGHPLITRMSFL